MLRNQKITFALLDTKDAPLIGIDDNRVKTERNFEVLQKAQLEYLERLNQLQQEIIEKYTPQLEDQTRLPAASFKDYGDWQKKHRKLKIYEYNDKLFYS